MQKLDLSLETLRVTTFEVAGREEAPVAPEAYSYNAYCTYPRASCIVSCPVQ